MSHKKKEPKLKGWFYLERESENFKRVKIKETISLTHHQDTFDELRQRMAEIEETYGDQFEKFCLEAEEDDSWGDDGPIMIFYFKGFREETDKEYTERLQRKAEQEAYREAREREKFEELKKKFG